MTALENDLAALSTRTRDSDDGVRNDNELVDVLGRFDLRRLQDLGQRNRNLRFIEQQCRSYFLGNNISVCKVLGRFSMFIDTRDRSIGIHLIAQGFWEPQVTECLSRLVKHGMRVIDLGANYGYYTLLMGDLAGRAGFVYAVEANPELAILLSDTLRINGMQSTSKVFPVAISDRVGKCWFLSDPKSPMNGHLVQNPPASTDLNTFDVDIVTLDTLISAGEHIDFMKIDVEGAEEFLFDGANRTLNENRNVAIVCEVNAARYTNPIEFFAKIRRFGFDLREISQDGTVVPVTVDQLISSTGDHMLVLERP